MPTPERSMFAKIHQQEGVLKNILLQQEALIDSNKEVIRTVIETKKEIEVLKVRAHRRSSRITNAYLIFGL